jgi:hypothetical protein
MAVIFFTVCSNNYLAQASVLGHSLKKQLDDVQFFTVLVDEYNETIDYTAFPFITIPIRNIEPGIDELSEKYNIVELNTCIKPRAFKYFFDNYAAKQVIYFDPDIVIYDTLQWINPLFESHSILLTPHILSAIPPDGKKPDENTFLNYGLYNLGFIGIQRSEESIKFIDWWKERTYINGFDKPGEGIFVDQLYVNLAPVFFKGVYIIADKGCNMAPWNLHERHLTKEDELYKVNNKETLKFFHFASFKLNANEFPLLFYNRFLMKNREDLHELYTDYNKKLLAANYPFYQAIDCIYYEHYIDKKMLFIKTAEQKKWDSKPFLKKLLFLTIPKPVANSILNWIQKIVNEYPYSSYK